jgi:hypothetical protein
MALCRFLLDRGGDQLAAWDSSLGILRSEATKCIAELPDVGELRVGALRRTRRTCLRFSVPEGVALYRNFAILLL